MRAKFLAIYLISVFLFTFFGATSEAFEPTVEGARAPGSEAFQTDLFTGRISTAIPIAVTPGRKGLQPNLSLVYTSGGGNSWCGVGWNIDVGSIQRNTKYGVPTYNDGLDTFISSVNGDGLTDIGIFHSGTWEISLSNGSSFLNPTTWLTGFSSGDLPFSGDFNVDGRTDVGVYNEASGNWQITISRGNDFVVYDTEWVQGFGGGDDWMPFAGNFDDSGRTGVGIYNKAIGQPDSGKWQFKTIPDDMQPPDYLKEIDNGLGGATEIQYAAYNTLEAICLPFPMLVVAQTTTDDGMGNRYTTQYSYGLSRYDGINREFRGFNSAQIIDHEGNVGETWFYQDDVFKGKPYHIETRDSAGNLYTVTEQAWKSKSPHPGVTFPYIEQTAQWTYDGDATAKQTRVASEYDSYGNITHIINYGQVPAGWDITDPPPWDGYEREVLTQYAYNVTDWILSAPAHTRTLDAESNIVSQQWFYYDYSETRFTPPIIGDLTKVEDWLSSDPDNSPKTYMIYDDYGNVKETIDPKGNPTTIIYDDIAHTFPVLTKNALGHQQVSTYDCAIGRVLTTTDPNGHTTENIYDVFARLIAVIQPGDSEQYPTISYEYDLASFPTRTIQRAREQSGTDQVLVSITYFNGFRQSIQTKTESENPSQQIVSNTTMYNYRGQVAQQWLPFFAPVSGDYTAPPPDPRPATFEYDP